MLFFDIPYTLIREKKSKKREFSRTLRGKNLKNTLLASLVEDGHKAGRYE
jgi:hypothetical protein